MDTKQSRKKRKPDKLPEKDLQNDKQLAFATRNSSNASKPGQKKQN